MNMFYFYAAIVIMLIIIVSDLLKKKYNINLDDVHMSDFKMIEDIVEKNSVKVSQNLIKKGTGTASLILLSAGKNKATVMATLRQITGLDYATAKNIVESAPTMFISEISEEEANLTKKALEFVGAKIQIR